MNRECRVRTATRNLALIVILACFSQPASCTAHDRPHDQSSDEALQERKSASVNNAVFYRNKLEFSVEGGVLPFNIPFLFDFLGGVPFVRLDSLNYTLVPFTGSLRWELDNPDAPWILRGTTDLTVSGNFTAIPRGPETRYGAFMWGLRRNFVRRNWRYVPYVEGHVGVGGCNAKGPDGIVGAQGQDLAFTLLVGAGVRYDFSPRYAMWGGATYMHISNLYLSLPKYPNYGLNVYGPTIGFDVRLGRPKR